MELQLSGAKEPELAREIGISQELHGFKDASQAGCRNDVDDGTVMAGDSDERSALGRAHGRRCFALEVLDCVCIFHGKKVYYVRAPMSSWALPIPGEFVNQRPRPGVRARNLPRVGEPTNRPSLTATSPRTATVLGRPSIFQPSNAL